MAPVPKVLLDLTVSILTQSSATVMNPSPSKLLNYEERSIDNNEECSHISLRESLRVSL
jgi:hypothetical protein